MWNVERSLFVWHWPYDLEGIAFRKDLSHSHFLSMFYICTSTIAVEAWLVLPLIPKFSSLFLYCTYTREIIPTRQAYLSIYKGDNSVVQFPVPWRVSSQWLGSRIRPSLWGRWQQSYTPPCSNKHTLLHWFFYHFKLGLVPLKCFNFGKNGVVNCSFWDKNMS